MITLANIHEIDKCLSRIDYIDEVIGRLNKAPASESARDKALPAILKCKNFYAEQLNSLLNKVSSDE